MRGLGIGIEMARKMLLEYLDCVPVISKPLKFQALIERPI